MKNTVISILKNAATAHRDAPYVIKKTDNGWEAQSYSEVDAISDRIGAAMIARGYAKGDRFAILSEGSPNWVIAEYSALKAGGICVPLSIKLLPEEIPFRLNHSGCRAIFVSHNTIGKVASVMKEVTCEGFQLIYLDDSLEPIAELMKTNGLEEGKQIILLKTLLEEGEMLPALDALNASVEGIEEDDVVTISYTSGTTGNPKGIMLTQKNYYANCHHSLSLFDIPDGYSHLIILPCDHSFAHTVGIFLATLKIFSLYFVDARGGSMGILRNIPINLLEVNPDILLTVPALTGNFMKKITQGVEAKGKFIAWLFHKGMAAGIAYHGNGYNTPSFGVRARNWFFYTLANALIFKKVRGIFGNKIKFCVGGGALLDINQQLFFNTLGVPIYQGYGLTEAAPVISSNAPQMHKFGTSGKVAEGMICKIMDPDGRECPRGVTGEMWVQGDNVMKGYYENPKATAETLVDGWLHTGDLAYYDDDDFLVVVGREKALLISEDGEKYSPEDIEGTIENTGTLINQVMVYNDHCKYTTAIITLETAEVEKRLDKAKPDAAGLLAEIRASFYEYQNRGKHFPAAWTPSTFFIAPEAFTEQNKMVNSTMKMVRFKVTEAYKAEIDYMYTPEGRNIENEHNLNTLKTLFKLN